MRHFWKFAVGLCMLKTVKNAKNVKTRYCSIYKHSSINLLRLSVVRSDSFSKIFCHMSISVFSLSLYSFNKLKFWVKVEMPCLNYSWGKEEPYRQQHTYILPHHPASLPQTIYHLELRVSSHICKYRCCLKGQSYQYRILDLS